MKFAFQDIYANSDSFLELCNFASNYGFSGIEIADAVQSKKSHADSIFRSSESAGAKRKLINRHIGISALVCPVIVESGVDGEIYKTYVELASRSSAVGVIVQIGSVDLDELKTILTPAISLAETYGVSIMIDTVGELSNTDKVLDIISIFSSSSVKVCWNIRETYFTAGESADKTIQTLGAYIGYVKIGDKKGDKKVLIGDGDLPVRDFANALRVWRFGIAVLSAIGGLYGTAAGFLILLLHLAGLKCLDVPYLAPTGKILRRRLKNSKLRTAYLHPQDRRNQK